LPDPFNDR
jgi:serine/threonine-protein phosphatase 2B catalytic subunit